jgi:hypothetical protein
LTHRLLMKIILSEARRKKVRIDRVLLALGSAHAHNLFFQSSGHGLVVHLRPLLPRLLGAHRLVADLRGQCQRPSSRSICAPLPFVSLS